MCNLTIYQCKPSIRKDELSNVVDLSLSGTVRAMLVSRERDGFVVQKVEQGESVLNIERDLVSHLNEYPHSDDWLRRLKRAIGQRLTARASASNSDALSVPRRRKWVIV